MRYLVQVSKQGGVALHGENEERILRSTRERSVSSREQGPPDLDKVTVSSAGIHVRSRSRRLAGTCRRLARSKKICANHLQVHVASLAPVLPARGTVAYRACCHLLSTRSTSSQVDHSIWCRTSKQDCD